MERNAEEVKVTLTVVVPATKGWRFHVSDALTNLGHTIVANPEFNEGKGDGCIYTYQYSIKGV